MIALERRPRGVDDERGQREKNQQGLNPPRVATSRFPEFALGKGHTACAIEPSPGLNLFVST